MTTATQNQMILDVIDGMEPIIVAILKYKAELEESGFSTGAAEQMAVDLHRGLVASAFGLKPRKHLA